VYRSMAEWVKSTDALVGLDGATLGHFDDLLDEGWIAATVDNHNNVGLTLQPQ